MSCWRRHQTRALWLNVCFDCETPKLVTSPMTSSYHCVALLTLGSCQSAHASPTQNCSLTLESSDVSGTSPMSSSHHRVASNKRSYWSEDWFNPTRDDYFYKRVVPWLHPARQAAWMRRPRTVNQAFLFSAPPCHPLMHYKWEPAVQCQRETCEASKTPQKNAAHFLSSSKEQPETAWPGRQETMWPPERTEHVGSEELMHNITWHWFWWYNAGLMFGDDVDL